MALSSSSSIVANFDSLKKYFDLHNRTKDVQAHVSKVHSVDWNADGRHLASGSFDRTVTLFSFSNDKLTKDHTLKGHTDSVDQLCWHPINNEILATASLDKTVRLWDARMAKCVATIDTPGENLNISWSPNGHTIAVGNKEDIVTFIDVRSSKIRTQKEFKFEVNEITWNRENDLFFLTSGQGFVYILSYPNLEQLHVFTAHLATCLCIEFDPTGKHFAVGSADALVSIWDSNNLACLRTVSRLEWPCRALSFSYDGMLLASASEDMFIDICHVDTGERIQAIPTESPTFTIAFHPQRYLLAYACDDKDGHQRDAGTVKLFGFKSQENL
ncbi:THO complex subunit 3 [Dermatophagoides farinae]|uniref:THO complex subunit 3 n=2 Tax=Dermatophagoides farinae TaxID=6954 RepID=A0A922L9P1_DERFA|nr:tho complex subunit 3-like protein [Dermatophagoides farinae]KAH9522897.1 THO complex subunit 3 [Dermatophagoides farinae]